MDDKMRAEFEKWAESKCMSLTRIHWASGIVSDYAYTATFDAWKVWQAAYQAGQKAEREAIFIELENGEILAAEVERLRAELAETKRWLDERSDAYGKTCGMVDQLQNELAAAKAASRCPVRVLNIFECVCESDRYIELRTDAEADTFADWLRDRIKDTPPPTT